VAAPVRPEPAYRRRAAAVREALAELGIGALLVTHAPNLRYLCGFDGSMGALLLTPDGSRLIVDGRYITAARGRVATSAELEHVQVELASGSLEESVAAALSAIATTSIGVEAGSMTLDRFGRLQALTGGRFVPTERVIEQVRLVKDAVEIDIMRTAARMLSDAATDALAAVRPGREERDVAADVEVALHRAGFTKPAFDTIVASGPNSALPHARPGSRVLGDGDGVVLDFGGIYDGYCVDLTRTVQLGAASASFNRVFEAVKAAHAAAIAAVRPGVTASSVDGAAREALSKRGLGEAFVHGTGHGLGLEVHEEPRVARAGTGRDEVLRAGMVFTVEPGAYLAGVGGVRIEDDVLVTASGYEVLTAVPIDLGSYGAAMERRGGRRSDPAGER